MQCGREAAVHEQIRPGDEGCAIGDQKLHGVTDLQHRAFSTQRGCARTVLASPASARTRGLPAAWRSAPATAIRSVHRVLPRPGPVVGRTPPARTWTARTPAPEFVDPTPQSRDRGRIGDVAGDSGCVGAFGAECGRGVTDACRIQVGDENPIRLSHPPRHGHAHAPGADGDRERAVGSFTGTDLVCHVGSMARPNSWSHASSRRPENVGRLAGTGMHPHPSRGMISSASQCRRSK